jgi:hypothetical protein
MSAFGERSDVNRLLLGAAGLAFFGRSLAWRSLALIRKQAERSSVCRTQVTSWAAISTYKLAALKVIGINGQQL